MRILIRLAVHHFVAQRVQAYERLVRLPLGHLLRQRTLHAVACIIECLAPDFGNPETAETHAGCPAHANRAEEHMPHQRGQGLVRIQATDLPHEIAERLPLGYVARTADI